LLYYARSTWYIRTSQFKDRLVELNSRSTGAGHIKNGRFGNWLENNVDWALGRERYWAHRFRSGVRRLPPPDCNWLAGRAFQAAGKDLKDMDLHRPHVDQIKLPAGMQRRDAARPRAD